jgi:hypothetical protein
MHPVATPVCSRIPSSLQTGPKNERTLTMSDYPPIIATIVVRRPRPDAFGLLATVDGRPRFFPNLEAVFRAAVQLLEEPGDDRDPKTVR